jgi:hypothetical protein
MLTIEKTHSGWIICKDDHPKSVRTMCISWDELLELHDLLGYEIQENERVQIIHRAGNAHITC